MYEEKLCFDDILLMPQYSRLNSRTEPDISMRLGHIKLSIPILSSPMDSVTGPNMLKAIGSMGGLGILSRYIGVPVEEELDEQTNAIHLARSRSTGDPEINVGCAIGIKNALYKTHRLIEECSCQVICLDVAHCDHMLAHKAIEEIVEYKNKNSFTFVLMAGNVCTPPATKRLIELGVNAIKIGIGPGAACTTRKVTGCGTPQLSAILDCITIAKENNVSIICDGGIRSTGDMVKSFWAGADACMIGYMLAGTDCTPPINGKKIYRGMSSRNVSCRKDIAPEGINIDVGYRGPTIEKLESFVQGIKSGLAMVGAKNIEELRRAKAIRISPLSIRESATL
jgi:IMP dehydrogenase